MTLSVAYITSRAEPEFQLMYDSIRRESDCPIIVIDQENFIVNRVYHNVGFFGPKPTVWSGPHRLTKEDWWSKANSLNSAICLCRTDWILFADDRSVLLPGWFARVKAAMDGNYAVCGKYEKVRGLIVADGLVKSYVEPVDEKGNKIGKDSREIYVRQHWGSASPVDCPGEWWFGCLNALPLEWALGVNGYDEHADGLGMEDVFFGMFLKNQGHTIKYDMEFSMIEDRTPGKLGPVMRREDKGISPHDKSHALVARLRGLNRATHPINLRDIRQALLQGGQFPPPWGPRTDFFDGQLLSEMK